MVERGINSPLTSSMGRLLDAVATLLGICTRATYEGEPAIELEAAASALGRTQRLHFSNAGGTPKRPRAASATLGDGAAEDPAPDTSAPQIIDFSNLLAALLDGIERGDDPGMLARMAHDAVARTIARAAATIAQREGLSHVALSGGCFMNRLLLTLIKRNLEANGLTVLAPRETPRQRPAASPTARPPSPEPSSPGNAGLPASARPCTRLLKRYRRRYHPSQSNRGTKAACRSVRCASKKEELCASPFPARFSRCAMMRRRPST